MEEKPKSIRSIRRLRKKQPKAIEGVKHTLFLRGNRSSNEVMSLMKDVRSLRKVHGNMFSKKHEIHPFESRDELQKICKKSDTPLFLFGSHSKKRPSNLVMGRTYQHKVLDMVELGIVNMTSIQDIIANSQVPFNVQPFIVFQGDLWESDEQFKKLRNLINDFFLMNNRPAGIQIDQAMKIVICWSITEDKKIFLNIFQVNVEGGSSILNEEGKIIVEQLGPNAQFNLRRQSFADEQSFKKATYVPKPKKKKENKNIKYDNLGNKRGKLYVDHQNFKSLPFKRRKLISKGSKQERKKGEQISKPKNQDQFGQ